MTRPTDQTSPACYGAPHRASRQPWAVDESQSGGRKFSEAPHPYRTCFQRDRDRIIHCSAFRRLDFKTQVFVPHEQDHFRTRLTHTLEVAQIARDLARASGANEDLAEVVALGHDLGHPPFGHAGEQILNELMSDHGGFEHNRQSLRIVDYLEHPYPDFRGLNLTEVVRQCLARHETKYDSPGAGEFPVGLYAPVEGQVVDMADEIAWTSADLEDALGCGILKVDQLAGLNLWEQGWKLAESEHRHAGAIHKRIRATKAVLALMADDVLASTKRTMTDAGVTTLDDVRHAGKRMVSFSSSFRTVVDELQKFLFDNVYVVGSNALHTRRAEKVIRRLFETYLTNPSLLPERYSRRIETDGDSPYRVACDYIAGMTDRFCLSEYHRICGEDRLADE